jgi:glutamyl/glutaminyl-tRNA synthetase
VSDVYITCKKRIIFLFFRIVKELSDIAVVTRFAPSPSGYLHIGGARTAAWNKLFALKHGGKFIFRIEDSDLKRSSDKNINSISDTLRWLGIDWDEGYGKGDDDTYRQSSKLNMYSSKARYLVSIGKAYPCFCSHDDIKKMKERKISKKQNSLYDRTCYNMDRDKMIKKMKSSPYCIRLITGNEKIKFKDDVKGDMNFSLSEIEDIVIIKSDGFPPKFAHVPVILNSKTGKKMSKRDGGSSVNELMDKGYPQKAVLAYISGLGCGLGKIKKFTIDEYSKKFNINNIKKQPSVHSVRVLDKLKRRLDKIG